MPEKQIKHTPGPWRAIGTGSEGYGVFPEVDVSREHRITNVARVTSGTLEQCKANAALIAAAPDLLAACEKVATASKFEPIGYDRDALEKIVLEIRGIMSAVIAKAKGETP